jgi:hypothetical protein
VIGIITALASFVLALRLSGTVFPFLSRKIFFPLSKVVMAEDKPISNGPCLYILENATILKALLLASLIPDIHFLLPKRKKKPIWYKWIHSMDEIEEQDTQEALVEKAKESLKNHRHCCLLLRDRFSISSNKASLFSNFFLKEKICIIKIEKDEAGNNRLSLSKLNS